MATDEIKTVTRVKGTPGDRYVKCPHCGETTYLPSGPVRGEQYQHKKSERFAGVGCDGWFEVAHDATLENAE